MAHKRQGGFERLKALKAKADKEISERKSQLSDARKAAAKREASAVDRARRDKKIKALNDKMDLLREDKKRIETKIKRFSLGVTLGDNPTEKQKQNRKAVKKIAEGVKSGAKKAVTGVKSGAKKAIIGIGGGVASKGVKAIKSRVGSKAAKKKTETKGPEFYRAKKLATQKKITRPLKKKKR